MDKSATSPGIGPFVVAPCDHCGSDAQILDGSSSGCPRLATDYLETAGGAEARRRCSAAVSASGSV